MTRNFERLKTHAEEVDVLGEKIKIYGLSFPELAEFTPYMDRKDSKGAMTYLLKTSLRKAYTVEELNDADLDKLVKEISGGAATQIINKVMELSGLGTVVEEAKKEVGGQ